MKTDRADVVHGTRRVVVVVLVSFASVVAANGVVPRRVQASLDVVIVVDVIVVARGAAVVKRTKRAKRAKRRASSRVSHRARSSPEDARRGVMPTIRPHTSTTLERRPSRTPSAHTVGAPGGHARQSLSHPLARVARSEVSCPRRETPRRRRGQSTTMDGHRPDDDDDQTESFIDEGAADYEEVADLDEDDEAPISSDDEDDADEEGEGDDEMEDEGRAATGDASPDRDDAECVACEHAAPVYCVAWSCDRECATVVSGGGDDKGYFRRGSEPARELRTRGERLRRRRFRRMVRCWRRVDWMDACACSTAAMESCVTRWKGPAVGSSG